MRQIDPQTGICFFRVPQATALRPFLAQADLSPLPFAISAQIDEWLEFGCVYVDGRRAREDLILAPEQIVRLHTRRKHYVAPPSLRDYIVMDHPEFLVLDKPAGLPTHPTLDNYIENAKVLLERELGYPLYTTHRLDVPTQGLLIIAKTKDSQRLINRLFSLRRVQKIYHSLNAAAVPLGLHVHYMDPESRVPKSVRSEPQATWWECRLQVESCTPTTAGHYAHRLTLLSGKTHQIRAQMAALGAPILGDEVYGGEKDQVHERLALECYQLSFTFRSGTYCVTRPKSIVVPGTHC